MYEPEGYDEPLDVEMQRMRNRHNHRPQKIRIALDTLALIPDKTQSSRQVLCVSKRYVRIVLHEAQIPRPQKTNGDSCRESP